MVESTAEYYRKNPKARKKRLAQQKRYNEGKGNGKRTGREITKDANPTYGSINSVGPSCPAFMCVEGTHNGMYCENEGKIILTIWKPFKVEN